MAHAEYTKLFKEAAEGMARIGEVLVALTPESDEDQRTFVSQRLYEYKESMYKRIRKVLEDYQSYLPADYF